jgi:CheY-like chemotaxis protein
MPLQVLSLLLEAAGFSLVHVMSGAATLAFLAACELLPDLILLDVSDPTLIKSTYIDIIYTKKLKSWSAMLATCSTLRVRYGRAQSRLCVVSMLSMQRMTGAREAHTSSS